MSRNSLGALRSEDSDQGDAMSVESKPLNPFLVTLVVIGLLGLTFAAVFGGVAARLVDDPLSAAIFWITAGWVLALGTASLLGALVAAAVRWHPRPATASEPGWSISYPDRDE
jgi:hypothetical protein